MAQHALDYIRGLGLDKLSKYMEAFSSCAIEGNRLGEVCSETLNRIMTGKPVSDRYVMGLAFALMRFEGMFEE
jgi:hypothetical protein